MERLTFDIGNIEIVQEEAPSYFSKLRIQVAKPGNNRHNLPISEDAIKDAAKTLVGKPILCHQKSNGQFGGHDTDEVPIGICALSENEIFFDGEWLCAYSYIWKRYFPDVVEHFSNLKDNETPISMEIDVLSIDKSKGDGLTWIEKFSFAGVTVIGVTPAIDGATGKIVEFSELEKEFEHDKLILFSSKNVMTHFPKRGQNKEVDIKNSQFAEFDYDYATNLKSEYPSVWSRGGNLKGEENFSMWSKAHSGDRSSTTTDWLKEREKFSARHNRDKSIGGVLAQVKWGMVSDHGIEYMKSEIEKSKLAHENSNRAYFDEGGNPMPYSKLGDINPSLKGIDPPISLGQANAIAKQADAVGADKGGWGIAIKHFKDSHEVKDGKWVEKNVNSNKEVKEKMTDEKEKVDMAATPEEKAAELKKKLAEEKKAEKKKEEAETIAEEKAETIAEEKKEEAEGTEMPMKKAKMSEFCDMEKMTAFVADSEFAAEFAAEAAKEDDVNFGLVVKACYAAMCKMSDKFDASEKDKQAYMAKADELEKKFAEIEKQKFSMAVESLLKDKDISESLSKDEVEECRTDSVNFSLETVSGWENKVKALAFTHAKGKKVENKVLTYALPFTNLPKPKDNGSVWPAQS